MENAILICSIAVNFLLTAIVLFFIFRLNRVEKRYSEFISKFDSKENIEVTLKNFIEMVNNVNEDNKIMHANFINLEKQLNRCFQNIGVVKYDAFDDIGSELSFVIALLNNEEDGFIINAIYGRSSSNIYSKKIEKGICNQTLSDEEIKALNEAKEFKKI